MTIEITEQAVEVLKRSLKLGNVPPEGGIRLRGARSLGGGFDVQIELAAGPEGAETTVETDGLRIFVDPSVTEVYPDALVSVEPQHETVVVGPLT